MAARRTARKTVGRTDTQFHCRDCVHSHDWQFIAHDGRKILGRCRFYKEDRFHKFLSDPQCEHFELRRQEQQEESNG